MNCSDSLCNFEVEFYCTCNDVLTLLCLNHSAIHTRDIKNSHNIRNFSISNYKKILHSFLRDQLSNLTSKILRETQESIKTLCLNASKNLKNIQNISNQLDFFFVKDYSNEEINEKMNILLTELNPVISEYVNDFQKNLNLLSSKKAFIRIPVRDYTIEVDNKLVSPSLPNKRYSNQIMKTNPVSIVEDNSYHIKKIIPLDEENIYRMEQITPGKPNEEHPPQVITNPNLKNNNRKGQWYIFSRNEWKRLPNFIIDQINHGKQRNWNEIRINNNGVFEAVVYLKEMKLHRINSRGLMCNNFEQLAYDPN